MKSENIFTISPSSLSYLCMHCEYMSQVHNLSYFGISPGITGTLDGIEKNFFLGDCKKLDNSLAEGTVIDPYNISFYSKLISDNKGRQFRFKGKGDAIIKFSDGTCGIIDYKTSKFKKNNDKDYSFKEADLEKKILEYSPQLHAYYLLYSNLERDPEFLRTLSKAKKVETIESGIKKTLSRINEISINEAKVFGLVFVYPENSEKNLMSDNSNLINIKFSYKFCPVKIELYNFMEKITDYLDILYKDSPPSRSNNCGMCNFLDSYDESK